MAGAKVIAVPAEPGKQREFAQFAGTEFHNLELSRSCSELGRMVEPQVAWFSIAYMCINIYIYILGFEYCET